MIHFIEEVFQVYVHDVIILFMDVLVRLSYRLMGIAIRPKAIAVLGERWFEFWLDRLTDC